MKFWHIGIFWYSFCSFGFRKYKIINMILPRKLFYQERESRQDFGTDTEGSLNQAIYNGWLLTRTELNPLDNSFYSKITKVFNDAYFICTVVLFDPSKEINLSYFNNMISLPSIVYPLACFYLLNFSKKQPNIKRLVTILEGNMFAAHDDWKKNYDDLKKIEKQKINESEFSPCKLDDLMLSEIGWWRVTDGYQTGEIEKVVRLFGKSKEERKAMARAIHEEIWRLEEESLFPTYSVGEGNPKQEKRTYPKAKKLCEMIIKGDESALFSEQQEKVEKVTNQKEREQLRYTKIALTEFLCEDWFVPASDGRETYDDQWKNKWISYMLSSEMQKTVMQDWWKEYKGRYSRQNYVKGGIARALLDCGVLDYSQIKELAFALQLDGVSHEYNDDYITPKRAAPYIACLKSFMNMNKGGGEPFSE